MSTKDVTVCGRFTIALDGDRVVVSDGKRTLRMGAQEAFDIGIWLGSYGVAANKGMFPMPAYAPKPTTR